MENIWQFQRLSNICLPQSKTEKENYTPFIDTSEEGIRLNPKYFWSYIKSIKSTNSIPNRMFHQGSLLTDGSEIAGAFNNYYHSVFDQTPTSKHNLNNCYSDSSTDMHTLYRNINKGA